MQLTVAPENIFESFALTNGQISRSLALSILGVGVSKAVLAADRTGVFKQLTDAPRTAVELARATNCSLHGMQVLLESLEGFGFVHRKSERYRLTKEVAGWIDSDGGLAKSLMQLVGDNLQLLQPEDVAEGTPPISRGEPRSPACWADYLAMIKNGGHQSSPQLVQWAKLDPAPRHLLDVAGGTADNSLAFCGRYPGLRADILELPEAARQGRRKIAAAGLDGHIRYIEGNLFETDWGKGYDLVVLSNVLHVLSARQCEAILAKAFRTLQPGGRVIIHDLFHPGSRGRISPGIGLFSLIYFVTCGGRTWPKPVLLEWLAGAGFGNIRAARRRLALLICAQRL
ncbi:class I SAM-dependent methyltransferase [Gloeobacter violaceus]|uniref:Gll0305 protein n=1 Tax=Gloeobacter violaceus (strain ATCC 29082 / PCC 7421) TaxID=251221 RepID=Q7NNV3_GLOVI|nr:class I SAM-dependent methyltransferase [Gloeobacter violaceus]BAC88246.1 gll0305 [Gloeobacter violaceus PCC 7421]